MKSPSKQTVFLLLAVIACGCASRRSAPASEPIGANDSLELEALTRTEQSLKTLSATVGYKFQGSYSSSFKREHPNFAEFGHSGHYSFQSDSAGWRMDENRNRYDRDLGPSVEKMTTICRGNKCYMFSTDAQQPGIKPGATIAQLPVPPYDPLMFGYRIGLDSISRELRAHSVRVQPLPNDPTFGREEQLSYDTPQYKVFLNLAIDWGMFPVSVVRRELPIKPAGYTEHAYEAQRLQRINGVLVPTQAQWEYRAFVNRERVMSYRAAITLSDVKVNSPATTPIDYSLAPGLMFTDYQSGEEFFSSPSGALYHLGWQGKGASPFAWIFVLGVTSAAILGLYKCVGFFAKRFRSPG